MTTPNDKVVHASERRHHIRIPFAARGIGEDELVAGGDFINVTGSDLSEGGLMLHVSREELVTPYGLLQLVFTPLDDGEVIQLTVQIVWRRRDVLFPKEACTIGCKFVHTPHRAIQMLLDRARQLRVRDDAA